jgi:GrpB-like predicted nucleotidyltransferase (UPF0157 family)
MLGLRRNTVRLVKHRPEWASIFEGEAADLRRVIGDIAIDIQHIGSTAIAGLPAKPILDMAIAVETPGAIRTVVERLSARGYVDRGDAGSDGGYLLIKDAAPDIRIVHAHVVAVTDPQWADYLRFRDILRRDAATRDRYAALKQSLVGRHHDDRTAYTAGKKAFIRDVLSRPGRIVS